MKDKIEQAGEKMLEGLDGRLARLERQYRRCEAHGARKAMESMRPELEELRMAVETEAQIFDLVMSNR